MSVVTKEKKKKYNLDIPFFFLEQPLTWRRQCSTNICKVKSAFHSESKHCSCGASQLSCSGEGGPDDRSEPIGTNLVDSSKCKMEARGFPQEGRRGANPGGAWTDADV